MPTIIRQEWGNTPDGPAHLFKLTNDHGNSVLVADYGGIVTSIKIAGREMVIGYDQLSGYLGDQPYYGALIGRYGNRIARGKFRIGAETYTLATNNGPNSLHGGLKGFDKQRWRAEHKTTQDAAWVTLHHVSPDGDEGFPGRLTVSCTYTWTNDDALSIDYRATTDKTTVVNLTNHSYFNIGEDPTVEAQLLTLKASHYTPVDNTQIPLGHLAPVAGTPFDFTTAKPIGQDLRADHPQIALANGYDHNWVLDDYDGNLREFAVLTDPASGRRLRCFTTEPGVQVFTANFAPGQFSGRGDTPLPTYAAICLETQHFPDAPNQEGFTTPLLHPGEVYTSRTVYRFE